VRVVARVGSPALSMSSMVDTGRGVGLSTDRPDARIGHRSSWIPPEKKGKHQARWTLNGTKINGGTFSTRAAAIQKRLEMESDLKAAGLVWRCGTTSYRRGDNIAGYYYGDPYKEFMARPENVESLRRLNPVRSLCPLCSLCSVLCAVLCALCSVLCSVLRAPCSVLGAPCSVLRAPCSVLQVHKCSSEPDVAWHLHERRCQEGTA